MLLTENSDLDRYDWASLKVTQLLERYPEASPALFDVGAGEHMLKQRLGSVPVSYQGFDLLPRNEQSRSWDISKPFPYQEPGPQLVTMLEVVEHLNNPWISLKNIAELIAPGGHLILSTPNPGWSTSRLALLFGGYLTCFTPADLELNHHVFTAWPHIMENLLAEHGFSVIEYSTLEGSTRIFDENSKWLRVIWQLPARLLKKLIEYRDPSAKGMSYGIVAKRIVKTA